MTEPQDSGDAYQELEPLSFGFWRELRRHGDDLIVPNNNSPADREKQCRCKSHRPLSVVKSHCFKMGAHTPAVTRVRHVELSEQADDSEGRASACDIIDLLLLLNLGVLGTGETVTLIFNETSAKKEDR